MPKAQLSKAWLDITGDSFVVDIRRPTTHGDVAKYVTKYVTKGFSGEVYRDHNRLAEAIDALHGRRLVITFGTWNGYRLFATVVPDGWSRYCELSYAIKKAREGNPHYTQILVLLRADWDTVAWNADATTWIGRDPDDDEPD